MQPAGQGRAYHRTYLRWNLSMGTCFHHLDSQIHWPNPWCRVSLVIPSKHMTSLLPIANPLCSNSQSFLCQMANVMPSLQSVGHLAAPGKFSRQECIVLAWTLLLGCWKDILGANGFEVCQVPGPPKDNIHLASFTSPFQEPTFIASLSLPPSLFFSWTAQDQLISKASPCNFPNSSIMSKKLLYRMLAYKDSDLPGSPKSSKEEALAELKLAHHKVPGCLKVHSAVNNSEALPPMGLFLFEAMVLNQGYLQAGALRRLSMTSSLMKRWCHLILTFNSSQASTSASRELSQWAHIIFWILELLRIWNGAHNVCSGFILVNAWSVSRASFSPESCHFLSRL